MSLSESRALTNVHPALAERIRYMGAVLDFWGGKQLYLSGFRTSEEQQILFDRRGRRPVARPGCSQHQYGFAVDVSWLPVMNFAENIQLSPKQTDDLMEQLGRQLGLTVVAGDTGHFQIFDGAFFKNWAVRSGFCDPTPVPPIATFSPPRTDFVFRTCGPGANSVMLHPLRGLVCIFPGD